MLKKVGEKVKEVISKRKEKAEANDRFSRYLDKFAKAKMYHDLTIFDEREAIYLGTKEVDMNVNSPSGARWKANNVINIIYEFIESQIDPTIPQPSVRAKRNDGKDLATIIEESLKNDITELSIEQINDQNERTTPIQGLSIVAVNWNNTIKKQNWVGEIELQNIHPKTFIPQPAVHDIQKMDYFFIITSVTKDYIKRRYDVDIAEIDGEEMPEMNVLGFDDANSSHNEKVSEITCWYKDSDGDICRMVWVNDELLEDKPKLFYRRDEQGNIMEFEVLPVDLELQTLDDMGQPVIIPAGSQVPYYVPKKYPISVRINVPKRFSFGGQSDIDVVRDQQDAIKKVVTAMEGKVLKGTTVIGALTSHNANITNEVYQVIKGTAQEINSLKAIELQANIMQDLEFARYMYKVAQDTLGINNTFQGKEDRTATSGIAKQIQVEQTQGRLQSKSYNKYRHFKELFEIIHEFKLAFYDEKRPYVTKDSKGQDVAKDFFKYDFLVNEDGEYFYNDQFIFEAVVGDELPTQKQWLYEQIMNLYGLQLLNPIQVWQLLEDLDFPMASDIRNQMEEQMKAEEQAMQEEQAMLEQQALAQGPAMMGEGELSPEEEFEQLFLELSPEQQEAYLNAPPDLQRAIMTATLQQGRIQGDI